MNMKKASEGEAKTQADLDWENRILCSDESCIGVIGPDGRCKECGKPHESNEIELSEQPAADLPEPESEASPDEPPETPSDLDWENRTLCSDESCIGVIGPDGRCKECGKPYSDRDIQ